MYSLKSLWSSIGVILLTVIIGLVGVEAYHAYMINHTYYYDMISSFAYWKLIISFMIISLLPIWVIFKKKVFSLSYLAWSSLVMMLLWGFIHVGAKGGLVGTTGSVLFLINMIILLGLIGIFLWWLYTGWALLYRKYINSNFTTWSDILLSLWGGLGIFLLLNYILVFTQLFFWPLAWLQLIGMGYLLWSQKAIWKDTSLIMTASIHDIRQQQTGQQIIILVLLIITLCYVLFSFNLSFIPYSTARDANHAYMYFPKVWALNNGLFFSEGPVATPFLWMVYISYWFSLFKPFGSSFLLAPDTVAVVLNNVSGRLALMFWLGATSSLINYFREKRIILSDLQSRYTFSIAWAYLLMWLMSGMGAFLVFVDNKTDLGVMSLTLLAIMSGFIFIKSLHNKHLESFSRKISDNIPAIMSWFFFALAVLSKPTAFQDLIIFLLFFIGIFTGILGLVGIFLLVLAVLGKAEAMSMVFYVSKTLATKLGIAGIVAVAAQTVLSRRSKLVQVMKPLIYWGATIAVLLFAFKGSFIVVHQTINKSFSGTQLIKWVLLGKGDESNKNKDTSFALLADSGNSLSQVNEETATSLPILKPDQCTLSSAGLTSDTLYDNLWDIQGGGLIEDLGRYIWFGQRVFSDPSTWTTQEQNSYGAIRLGYPLLKTFFRTPGCYSLNHTADQLCEDPEQGESIEGLEYLMSQVSTSSNQYLFLSWIVEKYKQLWQESSESSQDNISGDIQQALKTYVEGNVVHVSRDKNEKLLIAVPYAFLTPLNVIFNRSLQNLSSYYTDIGFVWILPLILLLAGIFYSIYNRKRELLILHLVTLAWWIMWWFLASGIIWYAVGIIAWTTFANALFLGSLMTKKSSPIYHRTVRILLGILVIAALIQTAFNLTRIASQGWAGPFVRYKGATGKSTEFVFSPQWFGQQEVIVYNYNAQDVFNAQFGHYNNFINHVKERSNKEGVLIAGTYIQYFLGNQNNIFADGLLTELWQWGSDNNTCHLDLRLEDKNIKYLVIDPNIWSVVQGEGNSSLFDRFLAKIDKKTQTIIEDGTMSMLIKMVEDGYLKLINTNNMGAKYAYTFTNNQITEAISSIGDSDIQEKLFNSFQSDSVLFKAKLAAPRFFPEEAQHYFILIGQIFQMRLQQSEGIQDMADILGKQVDSLKVAKALSLINDPKRSANLTELNKELSDDERTVLGYYLTIQQKLKANDARGVQEIIGQLLQASIAGWSQLITFERLH